MKQISEGGEFFTSKEATKKYVFDDGEFTFCTAHYGSWARDIRIVFRVRIDTTPEKRAIEKGIKYYDRLLPSLPYEIAEWVFTHSDFPIREEV